MAVVLNLKLAPIAMLILVAMIVLQLVVQSAQAAQVIVAGLCGSEIQLIGQDTFFPIFLPSRCRAFDVASILTELGEQLPPEAFGLSYKFDCTSKVLSKYTGTSNCSGVASEQVAFANCTSRTTYACAEVPDNKLVLMELGRCGGSNNFTAHSQHVMAINECLPQDSFLASLFGGGYARLEFFAANQTLAYSTYRDATCNQGRPVLTAKLDAECELFDKRRRRLQSNGAFGVSFKTVVPGTIISDSGSLKLPGLSVFSLVLYVVLFTLLL